MAERAIDQRMMIYPDRRRLRADAMTAHIMRLIDRFICPHDPEHNLHQRVSEELFKVFYASGVEIVTDMDRANAGLPPRNNQGWTEQELHIMEAKMTEAMLSPPKMFHMDGKY